MVLWFGEPQSPHDVGEIAKVAGEAMVCSWPSV
jgi:hypothetical protein